MNGNVSREALVTAALEDLERDLAETEDEIFKVAQSAAKRTAARLQRRFEQPGAPSRGLVGFALLALHAERWALAVERGDSAEPPAALAELCADADVREYLYRSYLGPHSRSGTTTDGLPAEYHDRRLKFAAAGTTSIIFRLPSGPYALKVLKPWFRNDPALNRPTSVYLDMYGHVAEDIAPKVRDCDDRYIVMKFIDHSKTLRDYWSDPEDRSLDAVALVLSRLCDHLEACAESRIYHGDLTADNILIVGTPADGRQWSLFLIDFGRNYIVMERNVGLKHQEDVLKGTIAPEVYDHDRGDARLEPTLLGDVYSVGVLLMQGLLGPGFKPNDLSVSLDQLYERYPEVGPTADELLEPLDRRRLVRAPRSARLYRELRQQLIEEITRAAQGTTPFLPRVISLVAQLPSLGVFKSVAEALRRPRIEPRDEQLMRAARFSDLAFALILMSFVFLAVRAIADGTWPEVGPGLLVGLVAGTVGWHYYQNIFAGIRAAELSRLVEFSIRINAVFFALPTLMAYLLDPRHWPVATAIGVASVSLNAWVCGRLCDRVAEKMRKDSRVTPAMDAARRALGDWGPLTAFYVVWLLCTEYGLTTGLLQDAWWYALTVSLLNAKMGIWNSTKEARLVRTGLARFISGLRRVNSPADAPTGAAMEPTLATAR